VFVQPTRRQTSFAGCWHEMKAIKSSLVGLTLGATARGGVADGAEACHEGPTETRTALRLPGRHPSKNAALPVTDLEEEEKAEEGRNVRAAQGPRRQHR
jgi:hypothetical protein